MNKILLSPYLIKIQDNSHHDQMLSRFNGTQDFFETSQSYLDNILRNIQNLQSQEHDLLHLTLESPPVVDIATRTLYGFFSSGISGQSYKIKDIVAHVDLLDVTPSHAAFRNIFFSMKIALGNEPSYLILQRTSKFGIKTILTRSMNDYLRNGFPNYRFYMNNLVHGQLYNRMMDEGSLKKVEFIKRTIPNTIEEYFAHGGVQNQTPGVLKTSFLSPSGLPNAFKQFISNLYDRPGNTRIEIDGVEDNFDDIEFELELNGKRKKFYVVRKSKIQPDIDVTDLVDYDQSNLPTTDSLLRESNNIITEILDLRPSNAN